MPRTPKAALLLIVALTPIGCVDDADVPPRAAPKPPAPDVARFVNPFIGTANASSPNPVTNGKSGAVYPGAAAPFGMVQWSPDTPKAAPPGYAWEDDHIVGFSLTHLSGAGCAAERDFPFFALVGAPDDLASEAFVHDAERASPGRYEVTLASGVEVELAATQRAGIARFTFPRSVDAKVLLSGTDIAADSIFTTAFDAHFDAKSGLLTASREAGFFCAAPSSYRIHLAARFDRTPSKVYANGEDGLVEGGTDVTGVHGSFAFAFDATENPVVRLRASVSYVSVENAIANLDAEVPDFDFDATAARTRAVWNDYLGRATPEGGTDDQTTVFTTALYRAMLQPAVASDVNGEHVGFDKQVHAADGWVRYQNYSGWDIYRSWVQLISVLAPDEASDMMRSLVESAHECGAVPQWGYLSNETAVMVGDPGAPLLAGAYAFGARRFDAEEALRILVRQGSVPGTACGARAARPGIADYISLGYCPADSTDPDLRGAASTTLEYAVSDAAVARLADALGKPDVRDAFATRATSWKNLFDGSREALGFSGYIEPRLKNGTFVHPAPASGDGFVEGNGAQYSFFVPHDVGALSAAMGGDEVTVARLDALFEQLNAGTSSPNAYMGNEPSFGLPWLYAFVGAPAKTQAVVRRILRELFAPTPSGVPGNEDLGAMSSWTVWAMLGLYPAMPGTGGLVIGSPTFPKMTLSLPKGRTIRITGKGAAPDAPYVSSLAIDGEKTTSTWIHWDDVANGATLDFELIREPSSWGSGAGDRPPRWLK